MKLLGSTKCGITKDQNGENAPHLETTEVILIHCNIVNSYLKQDLRVLYIFVPNKAFWSIIRYFTQKGYIFKNFGFRIFIY